MWPNKRFRRPGLTCEPAHDLMQDSQILHSLTDLLTTPNDSSDTFLRIWRLPVELCKSTSSFFDFNLNKNPRTNPSRTFQQHGQWYIHDDWWIDRSLYNKMSRLIRFKRCVYMVYLTNLHEPTWNLPL